MKTTFITDRPAEPVDPWGMVQYPFMVEKKGFGVAVASSDTEGLIICNGLSPLFVPMKHERHASTWKQSGWTPIKRPVTITFEN
jgi:hypothetical protein